MVWVSPEAEAPEKNGILPQGGAKFNYFGTSMVKKIAISITAGLVRTKTVLRQLERLKMHHFGTCAPAPDMVSMGALLCGIL